MDYNRAAAAFVNYCRASGQTAATVENHERNLRLFSEAVSLPYADAEITVAHIDEYKSLLHLRGLKQSTVRAYLESLCLFFDWATERKYCVENPCTPSAVKTKVPPPAPYGHLLTREEMAALLSPVCPKGCTRKLFNRNHAIVTVLLTSGLRNSELRELRVSDLIPSENRLIVRCGKGGKTRFAPYPPEAQEAVAAWLGCYDHDHHKFGLISPLNIEAGKHMNIEVVSGMVVGEFVCSKIDVYDYGYCTHPEIGMDYDCGDNWFCIDDADLKNACLSYEEFRQYADNKDMFGWHISNLKIYDKPKGLSSFASPDLISAWEEYAACEERFGTLMDVVPPDQFHYRIKRPPQSWCYVV